ncbi:cupin domain-containing protein [Pontiella agarivorans]|uniref:Cupin domain-containing protein n=1 Tax=Pontiella agarivorans TaxID=3038953 RepID=A0ABU5MYR3_9BACT|nr:cupin domain-containing protein [Pontiella agarivorans]MDZ8119349.1 cupin domain-containing protein [Pontiella agarivorans]
MKLVRINDVPETSVSHNAKIRKQVVVENGVVPHLTNYSRAVFPPGEKADRHVHRDMTEIFTCESGCGEIRVNEVGYEFSPGITVVVEPGDAHEIINTGPAELIVRYFGLVTD